MILFDIKIRIVPEIKHGSCAGCIFNHYDYNQDKTCNIQFPLNMDDNLKCGLGNNIIYKETLTTTLKKL